MFWMFMSMSKCNRLFLLEISISRNAVRSLKLRVYMLTNRKKENVAGGEERQNIYQIQKSETALFFCPPST